MYDDSSIILNVIMKLLVVVWRVVWALAFDLLVQGYPEASLTVCMHVYVTYENKSRVTAIKFC